MQAAPIEQQDAFTILVPVDFDPPSRRAVEVAEAYAHALHARIVILHVVPPTSFPEGTSVLPNDSSDPVDLEALVSERARKRLADDFLDVLSSGIEVRREARCGHPVTSILGAVDDLGAKMVILGTHARTGAARLLLGSVAEDIVRRSPVPVMVIR